MVSPDIDKKVDLNPKTKQKGNIQPVQKEIKLDKKQTQNVREYTSEDEGVEDARGEKQGQPRRSNLEPIGADAEDDHRWQGEVEDPSKNLNQNACACGQIFTSKEELEAHETICSDEKNDKRPEQNLPQQGQGF